MSGLEGRADPSRTSCRPRSRSHSGTAAPSHEFGQRASGAITDFDRSTQVDISMRRTLILALSLLLGTCGVRAQTGSSANTQQAAQISAQTGTLANAPANSASTVTGAIVPSGQGATGATNGGFGGVGPVAVPCPFGVSLSADLTAFGCASDPLGGLTYQIPAEAGSTATIRAPEAGTGVNAQTAASGTGSASGTSSGSRCQGAMPSTAGNTGSADVFGGGNC